MRAEYSASPLPTGVRFQMRSQGRGPARRRPAPAHTGCVSGILFLAHCSKEARRDDATVRLRRTISIDVNHVCNSRAFSLAIRRRKIDDTDIDNKIAHPPVSTAGLPPARAPERPSAATSTVVAAVTCSM
jgi:hypothetical protein